MSANQRIIPKNTCLVFPQLSLHTSVLLRKSEFWALQADIWLVTSTALVLMCLDATFT